MVHRPRKEARSALGISTEVQDSARVMWLVYRVDLWKISSDEARQRSPRGDSYYVYDHVVEVEREHSTDRIAVKVVDEPTPLAQASIMVGC